MIGPSCWNQRLESMIDPSCWNQVLDLVVGINEWTHAASLSLYIFSYRLNYIGGQGR